MISELNKRSVKVMDDLFRRPVEVMGKSGFYRKKFLLYLDLILCCSPWKLSLAY